MANERSSELFAPTEPPVPRWVEQWVKLSETAWVLPGTNLRFGLDSVLGFLLPGLGDWISSMAALGMIGEAARRQVPVSVLVRMLVNVMLDTALGSIPLLGDVYDFFFRSNTKNLELFRRHSGPILPTGEATRRLVLALGLIVATAAVLFWVSVMGLVSLALWAFLREKLS
ncbi:MAG: DUF4112 domain-containing protein [Polyangiaceae bacterium]|nr:DUF4112 domain-containing protein [Polyangiaceae bacterium]